jgi:hypothetical protein
LGEGLQYALPAVAVLFPASDGADALQCGVAHGVLQVGVVGEALEAVGECVGIADGDDEALDTVGEQVFAAAVG